MPMKPRRDGACDNGTPSLIYGSSWIPQGKASAQFPGESLKIRGANLAREKWT